MKTIKKLKNKKIVYLRIAQAKYKKELLRKKSRKNRRSACARRDKQLSKLKPKLVMGKNQKVNRRKKGYKHLICPEKLDLVNNYDESIEFIRTLREYAIGMRRPVVLVFKDVKEISSEALLFLLAELYRCRKIFGRTRITGTYPDCKKIEVMMQASGFFNLLNVAPRVNKKSKKYPLEYIEFMTGNKLIESTARMLRIAILGNSIQMGTIAAKRLFRAVSEAMVNVVNHAYPKAISSKNILRNQWWVSGHINKKTKTLNIMFCDLGVGIPATIPKVHGIEMIRAVLALLPTVKPNDAEMIKAGMEIGRTRTGIDGRGNGLHDLRKFVDDTGGGELDIFSRKGHYVYRAGHSETLTNFNYSIGGTLIKWSVPLENVTNWVASKVDENEDTHN